MKIQNQFSMYILTSLIILAACSTEEQPPTDIDGRPLIIKLGTIDVDIVETTPIVFKEKVYRFEYVRKGYWNNKTGDSYFRFVDPESGEATKLLQKDFILVVPL